MSSTICNPGPGNDIVEDEASEGFSVDSDPGPKVDAHGVFEII